MKVERLFSVLALGATALAAACGDDAGAGTTQSGAGGQSTSTTTQGAGGAPSTTTGSGGGAQAGNGGGGASPTSCPHIDLGRTVPAVYMGSTDGLPNLVTSNRLEWKEAPDDSLAFEAPSDGDYLITLDSAVAAMGASAEDASAAGGMHNPWTSATCPAAGATNEIDGVYNHNQPMYPLPLKAAQKIVIWVSVPYWSMTKSGPYKLTVSKK